MSDQPDLDYTINDPSSVECPHCHKKLDISGLIDGKTAFGGDCDHCNRYIQFEVQHDVTVLAWKPGALK